MNKGISMGVNWGIGTTLAGLGLSAVAYIVNDTFSETEDTTLASHTGEVGATWVSHPSYATGAAVVEASGDKVYFNTNSTCYYASGAPPSADYSVFATIYVQSNGASLSAGVIGRASTSANTFYLARYGGTSSGWQLYKFVNGSATQLGSTVVQSLSLSGSYSIELRMEGTSIKLFVDGAETISATDSDIADAGKVGIRGLGVTDSTGGYQLLNIYAR